MKQLHLVGEARTVTGIDKAPFVVRHPVDDAHVTLWVESDFTVPPIHVSAIGSYMACPRKWYYTSNDWGLGFRAPSSHRMNFGNWWHYATALYSSGMSRQSSLDLTQARIEEMLDYEADPYEYDLATDTIKLDNLFDSWADWNEDEGEMYSDANLTYHYIEQKFQVTINGVLVHGQFDAIVEHRETGEYFVLERKTTSRPEQLLEGIDYDYQPRVYVLAAEKFLGAEVTGVIYDIVKNTDPKSVRMLKTGLPSKAKTELEGTDIGTYTRILNQAIEVTGKDRDEVYSDYEEALDHCKKNGTIFARHMVWVSDYQRAITEEHLLQLRANMLVDRFGPNLPPPNLNRFQCGFCQYKTVCKAQDQGWGIENPADMVDFSLEVPRFDEPLDELLEEVHKGE